jgi:hypothetical protein
MTQKVALGAALGRAGLSEQRPPWCCDQERGPVRSAAGKGPWRVASHASQLNVWRCSKRGRIAIWRRQFLSRAASEVTVPALRH